MNTYESALRIEQDSSERSQQASLAGKWTGRQVSDHEEPHFDLWRRALVESGNGIVITDARQPDNPIIFCNSAFERISGYTAQEVIGRNCRLLQGPDTGGAAVRRIREALQQERNIEETLLNYRKDGTPFWNRLSISAVRDDAGKVTHYVGAQVDTTPSKRLEEEQNRRLEAHRADIEILKKRLKRAMTETHHRVKNSLQVLLAMLDMQVMQGKEMVPITEIERLEMHIHMLTGIHELLTEQAKTDAQASRVCVKAVLEHLQPFVQHMSGQRSVRFSLVEAQMPAQQVTSLAFVVNELISNAMKFGKGEIEVSLEIDEAVGELRVGVCDDGPGFPAGFEPLKASKTGLELVEHLTRWDLHGKIYYDNRPQGGARVMVITPLRSA